MNHPSFERMRAAAASLGSSATTVRGVLRFLRGDRRAKAAIRTAVDPTGRDYRASWESRVAKRKADPDAKLARDDKRYRKLYLARLRKQEAAQLSFDATTAAGVSDFADSQPKRESALKEVARLRSIVYGKQVKPTSLHEWDRSKVRMGIIPIQSATARRLGVKLILRGKDSGIYSCIGKSFFVHEDPVTKWKNGKPRTESRAVNDNYVRSFGLIVNPQRLECLFHETALTVELPDGYAWEIDGNGIKAVDVSSRRDDYHPTADDLIAGNAADSIVLRLNINRRAREEMAAKVAVEAAAVQGVYVCLADSLRAGNCWAGTMAFGQRHGLDPARHYTAPELLAMANGDGSRVRLAVTAARLRHEREEKAGVCLLADHRA